ncbi:PD-(D/E)XK nuclease family protein [Halopiger xanaduensis]|uniref:Uncharacterized protein n=1 Tax=Halopiger xanaduensis (strain DSM 18323 / JCM 14033 / SH-6) TaxID=797210 RepID=F8DES2_HALXS|nr:PD-(D/E)XK nuclease family protein [Halopiger xanaduensis]AEH39512.1 hypothetical protein Halxa_0272 [Halopiger xanaduensis SH-6]
MTTTDAEPINFERELQAALERANDDESHVERDAVTFHPSQIAACERQAYLGKLGLKDHTDILGTFQTGTLIHEFIEENVGPQLADAEFEKEISLERDGVRFVGHTDCYDPAANAIYDFKSRNGWYRFDPPKERHLDQIHVYMAATGAEYGQVVYVNKGDLEVRTWPEDGLFEFDPDRFAAIVEKARRVRDAIDEHGFATCESEVPFDKCGCFLCGNETLTFD